MRRRRNRRYYEYEPPRSGSRYPDRRSGSRYRSGYHEGCLDRTIRVLTNLVLVVLISSVAIILLVYGFTHFQQVIQFVKAIFAALSFLIAVFPLVLHGVLILLAIAAVLFVIYGVIHIISSISERMARASLASSKAKQARVEARLKNDQGRLEVQRKQVQLASEGHLYDQRVRKDALGDGARPAPVGQRATRNLALDPPESEDQAKQGQPSQPPVIPDIRRLLGTMVKAGQTDMLHGFEVVDGSVEAVRGEMPGTAIISGRSGSGKTRRIILMIFQALLIFQALGKGYKITVCDPHAEKPDGLLKVLAPFIPWLHVARTYPEIVAAAREHIDEMESRLTPGGSRNGEGLMSRLIIFDEFPKMMKRKDISKADKETIAECVRESAVQYRGIFGYAWIIGQEWTQDAIFDTAIRRDAQAIFCHQLSAAYAAFLFELETAIQRLVQQIERRECVFKDADNHVRRIITTTVPDEAIPVMVDYLDRYVPRPVPQRRTQPIPRRPSAQLVSPRIAPALPQSATFYVRETDRLDQPVSQSLPTLAVWQNPLHNDGRQHRGFNSARALQRSYGAPPSQAQSPVVQQTAQTRVIFDPASVPEADGSWDDTVLVSESSIIVPSSHQQEVQSEPGVQIDPVARLAQLRRRQRQGEHKI